MESPLLAKEPNVMTLGAGMAETKDPILEKELWALVEVWPQLAELLHASERKGRWNHALSSLSATSRAEMAAALHSARALRGAKTIREEIDLAVLIFHGTERHETLRLLQQGGMAFLAKMWHLQSEQFKQACEVIDKLVGQAPEWSTSQMVHCPHTLPRNPPVQFPHTLRLWCSIVSRLELGLSLTCLCCPPTWLV